MDIEERKKLLAGSFGKELLKAACSYCIPLFWTDSNNANNPVLNNGTAFILDCGQGPFVVTAAHIYEAYISVLETRAVQPWLSCLPFPMEDRVHGYKGTGAVDLVTFKISDKEIGEIGKNVLHGDQAKWPPNRIAEGQAALFAGFPGNQRIEEGPLECNFGIYSALAMASSVNDRHFGCAFEREHWIDSMELGLPEEGFDIGGVSGCPVLAIDESPTGILSWRLVGIGYEATNQIGEIFFSLHASFINPDGTLAVS